MYGIEIKREKWCINYLDQDINKSITNLDLEIEKYPNLKVGFSNHYSGALACHGAVVLGAEVIEFHITKDRTMYGSDQAASIENVDALVSGIRNLELMMGDGKKIVYEDEKPIANKLRKNHTILQ